MKTKAKQGKANRAAGKRFELKVRADLESDGWIVFRNSNDVKQIDNKNGQTIRFQQTTGHWNPFTRTIMVSQSGFPDFICLRDDGTESFDKNILMTNFKPMFVECKTNGHLDKIEKEKVKWIREKLKIPVFIASVGDKRGEIKYETA